MHSSINEEFAITVSNNNINKLNFSIEQYQRQFVWDEGDIDNLYASINKGIYLGTGTFVRQSVKQGSRIEVVDGQQRLTSIMLMIGHMIVNSDDKLLFKYNKDDVSVNVNAIFSAKTTEELKGYLSTDDGYIRRLAYLKRYVLSKYTSLELTNIMDNFKMMYIDLEKWMPKGFIGGIDGYSKETFSAMNNNGRTVSIAQLFKNKIVSDMKIASKNKKGIKKGDHIKVNSIWYEIISLFINYTDKRYDGRGANFDLTFAQVYNASITDIKCPGISKTSKYEELSNFDSNIINNFLSCLEMVYKNTECVELSRKKFPIKNEYQFMITNIFGKKNYLLIELIFALHINCKGMTYNQLYKINSSVSLALSMLEYFEYKKKDIKTMIRECIVSTTSSDSKKILGKLSELILVIFKGNLINKPVSIKITNSDSYGPNKADSNRTKRYLIIVESIRSFIKLKNNSSELNENSIKNKVKCIHNTFTRNSTAIKPEKFNVEHYFLNRKGKITLDECLICTVDLNKEFEKPWPRYTTIKRIKSIKANADLLNYQETHLSTIENLILDYYNEVFDKEIDTIDCIDDDFIIESKKIKNHFLSKSDDEKVEFSWL